MKKLLTVLFTWVSVYSLHAQTVTVKPTSDFILSSQAKGAQTTLYIDEKYVTKGWKDFLKEYGKIESPKGGKNIFNVAAGKMPTVSFAPVVITSKLTNSNGATTVFYAIQADSAFITDPAHPKYAVAQDLLHDFGVKMYKEQVTREVDEAQKELDKRIRTNNQLVRKGEDLQKDVERNKKDKINFDDQLVKNHSDSVQLVRDIEANKEQQKQATEALEKQKVVMAALKSSLDSAGILYNSKKKKDLPAEMQTSEKELKNREKEYDKSVKTGESLRKELERNGRQKIELQNKLAKNAAEKERLPGEIEANLKEQKNAQTEIEKQKKVVDQVRAKADLIK